jgi:hypothetical protein
MSIPDFTPDGFLPPGVHDASVEEIRSRFGTFQGSDRRPRLVEKLEQLLAEARQTGLVVAVIVDGSFVTATPKPDDIDLILLVRPGHDFSADLRPPEYNVLSRRRVRKRYGFDMMIAADGSELAAEYVKFFAQVRERRDARKGMVSVRMVERPGDAVSKG